MMRIPKPLTGIEATAVVITAGFPIDPRYYREGRRRAR